MSKTNGSCRDEDILNKSQGTTRVASKDAMRHCNARDEQDILPEKAPSGRETTGHRKRSTKNRSGRKRGPRSMGRYPFLTELGRYIEENRPFKASSTLKQEERTLRRIHGHLQELKEKGLVLSTNPMNIAQKDIGALILYIKEKGLDTNTQAKYCQYLKSLLSWSNNSVMEVMSKKRMLPLENRNKEIISLTESEVFTLVELSQTMEGWKGTIISFLIPMFYYTGLRPSELRRANLKDLDTDKWIMKVSHPKGEGTWGKKRSVPIVQPLKAHLLQFLDERDKRLLEYPTIETDALIPNLSRFNSTGKIYTHQSLLRMKAELEDLANIKFDFRTLRRTCGQHLRNRSVPIDAVSKILGHSSTTTTEKYYARIRDEHAFQYAEDAWSQRPLTQDA